MKLERMQVGMTEVEDITSLETLEDIVWSVLFIIKDAKSLDDQGSQTERIVRKDNLNDILLDFVMNRDPGFIEDWTDKVTAASGSKNRWKKSLTEYRSVKFQVHSQDKFKWIQRLVRDLELPAQPSTGASLEDKNAWGTECVTLKFHCIEKTDMVYTFLYHKWIHDHSQ